MITYESEKDPHEVGVYACRIADPQGSGLIKDQFLMWRGFRWWYLGSDQRCSAEVFGWVGPLSRRLGPPVKKAPVVEDDW